MSSYVQLVQVAPVAPVAPTRIQCRSSHVQPCPAGAGRYAFLSLCTHPLLINPCSVFLDRGFRRLLLMVSRGELQAANRFDPSLIFQVLDDCLSSSLLLSEQRERAGVCFSCLLCPSYCDVFLRREEPLLLVLFGRVALNGTGSPRR